MNQRFIESCTGPLSVRPLTKRFQQQSLLMHSLMMIVIIAVVARIKRSLPRKGPPWLYLELFFVISRELYILDTTISSSGKYYYSRLLLFEEEDRYTVGSNVKNFLAWRGQLHWSTWVMSYFIRSTQISSRLSIHLLAALSGVEDGHRSLLWTHRLLCNENTDKPGCKCIKLAYVS